MYFFYIVSTWEAKSKRRETRNGEEMKCAGRGAARTTHLCQVGINLFGFFFLCLPQRKCISFFPEDDGKNAVVCCTWGPGCSRLWIASASWVYTIGWEEAVLLKWSARPQPFLCSFHNKSDPLPLPHFSRRLFISPSSVYPPASVSLCMQNCITHFISL